jgi:hypothetical protein
LFFTRIQKKVTFTGLFSFKTKAMSNKIQLSIFLLFCIQVLNAQSIKVQPYLQDASPHSIFILWETDSLSESIVEWGLTDDLVNTSTGTAITSAGTAQIHEVQLVNLERFTKYFYRVKAGDAVSAIFQFKTPPFASDHEPFRIIAMSDMQQDGAFPNKFQEIVNEGIMDYLSDEFGGEIIDQVALVMISGDLVSNGNNYESWANTFFNPAENLFSQVPVYPVPGNHENNSTYFFQYFKLPENGTSNLEEHWWHKDYGNVRIIGLDSNGPYDGPEQLDWLENTLAETATADSIDFVFAQLHHPHKSELWTPGESNFTGEVINKLEQFSTESGKPSIHFFGHTHGYSRGQSRDHKHLWINVATAGGAIDNWGEFPNFDYDEFSVSQDDYGFVSIEITDDADPKVVVKRISRGDQDAVIDNEITDSLTLRLFPLTVDIPLPIFPLDETIFPECVTLKASLFSSPNASATHGQSHWQVSTNPDGFDNPIAESWKNFENWYFEEDTQANDDLTDEKILGLGENTDYWWRVRYRDREMNWSDWTAAVPFLTGESMALPNLLMNAGAEDSLSNWSVIEGVVEALTAGVCEGINPHSGERYFAVGGLCEHSDVGRCVQAVDVSTFADSIDAGGYLVNFGGFLSDFGGSDLPEMRLLFFDENLVELGTSNTLSTLNASWTMFSEWQSIPPQTRTIQLELKGTRNAGTDNDSYFDDLFLTVGASDIDCTGFVSVVNQPMPKAALNMVPNPMNSSGNIALPEGIFTDLKLFVVDAKGVKMACPIRYEMDRVVVEKGNLKSGTYFFFLRGNGAVLGSGKMVVVD